jgi:three-Cys-motif partner protein
MLEFAGDAISLSGLTGTRLKSAVIGWYYPFWWNITSGGKARNFSYPTAIVELNAATGEVYIEETKETLLGSAGHALELKVNSEGTDNLKVVLVEEDAECYAHLRNAVKRRWPSISLTEAEGSVDLNSSNIYLLNTKLGEALQAIESLNLGNAVYFFDPLRSVEWTNTQEVAKRRIRSFYQTWTEFLIFLFTSDWFLGRKDFEPLPTTSKENDWSEEQRDTVLQGDALFGSEEWRSQILIPDSVEERERLLVELYKDKLRAWFRYVLPLPFNPKSSQLFHLILCSNYEDGVKATRQEFAKMTDNPKYTPDNPSAFRRFTVLHPEIFRGLRGKHRPCEWKILWSVITSHEEGRCDCMCRDLYETAESSAKTESVLQWLAEQGYLKNIEGNTAWPMETFKRYSLDWEAVRKKLGTEAPPLITPLSPEQVGQNEVT